MHSKIDITAK